MVPEKIYLRGCRPNSRKACYGNRDTQLQKIAATIQAAQSLFTSGIAVDTSIASQYAWQLDTAGRCIVKNEWSTDLLRKISEIRNQLMEILGYDRIYLS
jgi:hypothetical protein